MFRESTWKVSDMKNPCFIILFLILSITTDVPAVEREVLHVGVRPAIPPFCFLSKDGGEVGLRGINVDLMTQIGRHLGVCLLYTSDAADE